MSEKLNEFDVTLESLESIKPKLPSVEKQLDEIKVLLGFDGYIDSLYSLVQTRDTVEIWDKMNSMKLFGERVLDVVGSSANVERVLKRKISGGFAPNTCRAINGLGIKNCLMAAIGYPNINELFLPLANHPKINAIPIGNPGETAGLEFDDGKIMLTDFENVYKIRWQSIIERVGVEILTEELQNSNTYGFGHWSLVASLDEIWEHLLNDIFPTLSDLKDKLFFVDLADIKKRTQSDILNMLDLLEKINELVPVMLSLNDQEAIDISKALKSVKIIDPKRENHGDYIQGGKLINDKVNLSYLIIHSPHFATISTDNDHYWVTEGFTTKPSFTTGAGDHFHSGAAVGLTLGLPPPEALIMGNALTAIFVRTGKSPNFTELTQFISNYMDYVEHDNPNFP